MKKLDYMLVDVFTDKMFGGNPLAVFYNGESVPESAMPRIAKELNLSETTFVLPSDEADFRLRIFTPAVELPMAGHPTVGTAFVLAHLRRIAPLTKGEKSITFMEGVGEIPVELRYEDGEPSLITMDQPLPIFHDEISKRAGIAEMLSLAESDLADFPIQVVSTGTPFTLVPLKNLSAVRRANLRIDLWQSLLKDTTAPDVFIFASETEEAASSVHSRMFAPSFNIPEDPATGAASGSLGAYLVKHGWVKPADDGIAHIISEQGFEMGRPSYIRIGIHTRDGIISRVRVGGQSILVGGGYFELAD